MNTVSREIEVETSPVTSNRAKGQSAPAESGHHMHRFQPGLGDHPLWQALMDEMEKIVRQTLPKLNAWQI